MRDDIERRATASLTQERVKLLLDYDHFSGKLFFKHREPSSFADGKMSKEGKARQWNARYAGKEAFTNKTVKDAFRGELENVSYFAHRIAFLWWHGWLPEEVDHINGDPRDNSINNLRAATRLTNGKNRRRGKTNRSGCTGVTAEKGKWRACIWENGRKIHLGYFDKYEDAVKCRKDAERKFGYHPNHDNATREELGLTPL